jgi:Fe-S cluster assembly protein SufD
VDDKATAVFNGKVMVRQDAQKTNAFQQNSTVVLSPRATMNTKPQLEIFADDVKCSHGATIGQLDESAMYYMRTRGFSKDAARKMLQFAFVAEVIENVPNQEIHSTILDIMRKKLDNNS